MNTADYINISINTFCAAICLLILFFVAASEHGKEKRSRIFIRIIIVNIVGVSAIIAEGFFNINVLTENIELKKIFIMLNSLGGPIILVFFIEMIVTIFKERTAISKTAKYAAYVAVALCIIDIICVIGMMTIAMPPMTNLSHYLVSREFNDWFLFSQTLSLICMAIGAGLLIMHKMFLSKRELITLLSYIVLPLVAIIVEIYFLRGVMLISFSITLVIFIYYASIQSELSSQIKKKELELKNKELELTEGKISIMLSQIQPHFLHNALTAIAQLCDDDPGKAKKATMDFSVYLRNNMESLNHKGLINVDKEISHVKGYLDLEEAIYGDDPGGNKLNVIYRIEAGGFQLPPLTIQPIAENAVKHGVGQKEGGGTVTLSVCETDDEFQVKITDDGVGYDVDCPYDDGREHIGIVNVRRRIKEQCGGTLEISSEIGRGTTAVIRIPKNPHGFERI